MSDHFVIANSPLMFLLCGIVILYVLGQSLFFMIRAWKHGKAIGLSTQTMKSVITGSALFSIVPSIPILIILVMLMSALGNYFPWLRLSVIGSSSYENVAANIAARSFGLLSYTDDGCNASIFISTMWAMSICILYEPLLVIFGQKKLDKGMTTLWHRKNQRYHCGFADPNGSGGNYGRLYGRGRNPDVQHHQRDHHLDGDLRGG